MNESVLKERDPARRLSQYATARATQMIDALVHDSSPFALRPSNMEGLQGAVESMLRDLELSAPENTADNEASSWRRYWEPYCRLMGTTPLRADAAANAGFDMDGHSRETLLLAIAVPWVYEHMQGRRRDASGVLLPPLPSSVLNVLRNVRRAHKRLGITMAPLTLAVQATERLIQRYRDEHGPEALQPRRKEPLTNAIVVALLTLPAGTVVGSTAVDYARLEWISLRAQYAVHAQTGMRKSETCIPNGRAFGKKHLSRANLAWKIGGVFVRDPSRVQLAALREGDFAVLIVAPSKADQHGLHWGQAPIYLPYHARDDICAARALAALELAWELHGAERRTSPRSLWLAMTSAP